MIPARGRRLRTILICAAAGAAAIQLVPFGREHRNPPASGEPAWDSPDTQALFRRACADCHSNETRWPWYSHVAPASWLVQNDVDEGRSKFNVSEWGRPRRNEGGEAAGMLRSGEMPLRMYPVAHPEARLSAGERAALIAGLKATFGAGERGGAAGED